MIETDLPAANGLIHVIDQVLVPPSDEPALGALPTVLTEDGRATCGRR